MQQIRGAGHLIAALDVEALPLTNPLDAVSENAVEYCHVFLVDSLPHRKILAKHFSKRSSKFKVAGSARIEALRSHSAVPDTKNPYILFNTSFALVNSIWENNTAIEAALKVLGEKTTNDMIKGQEAGLGVMREVIDWILPRHRVVIRPHPAERAQYWRDEFPQAEIIEGSAPIPWMCGAKALVHPSSTTGIEAAIIGTPALNLDPVAEHGDYYTVRAVNRTVATADEAIAVLDQFLNGENVLSGSVPTESLFPSHGGRKIAQAILKLLGKAPPISGDFRWTTVPRTDSQIAKFTVSLDEVNASLDRAAAITNVTQRTVHQLDDSVFLLIP